MSVACRVVRKHVDAMVDGELDTTTQVEFDQHLGACPICREHVLFARSVKTATKRALAPVRAPDALRLRVLTALDAAPPPARRVEPSPPITVRAGPRRGRWAYVVPVAAAAAVLVVFGGASDGEEVLPPALAPIAEDVVRRHSAAPPPEVSGSRSQVAGFFRGMLAFPARPVEFDEAGDAALVGARLSNVRERDAAAFYYDVGGRRVTVMVFELPPSAFEGAERVHLHGRDVYYRNVHGYTVPVVAEDGLAYAFTGDLDANSMMRLAATARVAH